MEWFEKPQRENQPVRRRKTDVLVSKYGSTKNGFSFAFSFKAETCFKISKTGYIKFGIDGDRLYFAEASSGGYKLSKSKGSGTRLIAKLRITDRTSVFSGWLGKHSIQYDSKEKLYFISSAEEGEN